MNKEVWKDIEEYEGLYQISNYGRVKSLKRKYVKNDKILKPYVKNNGYLEVMLVDSGLNKKKHYVHRLVAKSYIENKNKKQIYINHINGKKNDNRVENLEWVTNGENIRHGIETGLIIMKAKGRAKKKPVCQLDLLTDNIINFFPSIRQAERETGVSNSHICLCCQRKEKSAGGYKWQYMKQSNC